MATTKVNHTPIKTKNGTIYRIDYIVNGRRVRERVGSNRFNECPVVMLLSIFANGHLAKKHVSI